MAPPTFIARWWRNGQASLRLSVESVRLYVTYRSTTATAAGGFAAERPAGRRYQSTAAGAVLQAPALSSKFGQRYVANRRRRLNTDLLLDAYNIVFAVSHSSSDCFVELSER